MIRSTFQFHCSVCWLQPVKAHIILLTQFYFRPMYIPACIGMLQNSWNSNESTCSLSLNCGQPTWFPYIQPNLQLISVHVLMVQAWLRSKSAENEWSTHIIFLPQLYFLPKRLPVSMSMLSVSWIPWSAHIISVSQLWSAHIQPTWIRYGNQILRWLAVAY